MDYTDKEILDAVQMLQGNKYISKTIYSARLSTRLNEEDEWLGYRNPGYIGFGRVKKRQSLPA